MKVLVTGGCGLIGSHVAEYYQDQGDEVVVVDNLERSQLLGHEVSPQRQLYNYNRLTEKGIEIAKIDISVGYNWKNWIAPMGPFDAIVHCAAQCGVPTSIANPQRDFDVNVYGTALALEWAREWGARMVYASTNKVYPIHKGWTLQDGRWRWEDDELHTHGWPISGMNSLYYCYGPRTPYGNSKYLGDLTCQEWAATYGVEVGVFRMSCIYGEHQMGFEEQGWATWFAIAQKLERPVTIYGDGLQVRDMLHVSDVVRAYDSFIKSDVVRGGVWNLGGGPNNTLSLVECMNLLEDLNGTEFTDVTLSEWRPSDQRVYTSDIRELKLLFDWEPIVSPHVGMKKVSEWVSETAKIF